MKYLIRILVLLIYFTGGVLELIYMYPAIIMLPVLMGFNFIINGKFEFKSNIEDKIILLPLDTFFKLGEKLLSKYK